MIHTIKSDMLMEVFWKTAAAEETSKLIVHEKKITSFSELQSLQPGLLFLPLRESSQLLSQCPLQTLRPYQFQLCDLYSIGQNGKIESHLWTFDVLYDLIVTQSSHISRHERVYLFGEAEFLRVAAGVCLHLGFKKIVFIDPELRFELAREKQILHRMYPDSTEFVLMQPQELTLQSVDGVLFINQLDLRQWSSLALDMAYFNYLKKDALLLHFSFGEGSAKLIEEATASGLNRNIDFAQVSRAYHHFLKNHPFVQ